MRAAACALRQYLRQYRIPQGLCPQNSPVTPRCHVVTPGYRAVSSGRFGDPDTFGDLRSPVEWEETIDAEPKERAARTRGSEGNKDNELAEGGVEGQEGRLDVCDEVAEPSLSSVSSSLSSDAQYWRYTSVAPASHSDSSPASSTSVTTASASASASVVDWELVEDDADDVEKEQLDQLISGIPKTGMNSHGFGRKMKRMIRRGQLKEALELFEHQMLPVDRVQPDNFVYNVLISGCGQAGDTYKAFRLYNDMKKRRLKANHKTYTSLLNACANGFHPADSLKKIERLRQIMLEKGYQMNVINYHALIKAYGRCGQLQLAFATADELLQLGHPLTAELASFLLQGCIGDKEHGFRHALLVWHQLRQKQVQPNIFAYNLLLRAALECEAGETAIFEQAMEAIVAGSPSDVVSGKDHSATRQRPESRKESGKTLPEFASTSAPAASSAGTSAQETPETRLLASLVQAGVTSQDDCRLPNLVSQEPSRGGLVQLRHLDTPEARVGLMGGWVGVLRTMASDGVQPDIKTFSLLLKALPHDLHQEESLMRIMDAAGVDADVGFFNQLIKKRCSGRQHHTVEGLVTRMQEKEVQPDVATYGCLAMSVRNCRDANAFFARLEKSDVRPNVEMLTTLLRSAAHASHPRLALLAMEAFVKHQVAPDRRVLTLLEELRLSLRQLLIDKERDQKVPAAVQRDSFASGARNFFLRYPVWLSEVEAEEETYPTRQYRVTPLKQRAAQLAAERAQEQEEEAEEPIRADWRERERRMREDLA